MKITLIKINGFENITATTYNTDNENIRNYEEAESIVTDENLICSEGFKVEKEEGMMIITDEQAIREVKELSEVSDFEVGSKVFVK